MVLETCKKLCVTELDVLEKRFCPQNWKNGPKMGQERVFLNLLKNCVNNFYSICAIMKTDITYCVPAQIPYLGKFLFPSIYPGIFLELYHQFFLNFGMVLETCKKLCVTELDVLEKRFCPQNWKNGPKLGQKRVFLNLFKNCVNNFYSICAIMKNDITCCVPAQIPYLGKFLFLR